VTGEFTALSQAGVDGAFLAASNADVGSPARFVTSTQNSLALQSRLSGGSIQIQFNPRQAATYRLEYRDLLGNGNWISSAQPLITPATGPSYFEEPATAPLRFYRVVEERAE
jgi:hypothetical protein